MKVASERVLVSSLVGNGSPLLALREAVRTALVQIWNLGEGLEAEPSWINRYVALRIPNLGGLSLLPEWLCEPPIDNQCFPILAKHDIAWLEVTVKDPSAMRVLDGIAYIHKTSQHFPKLKLIVVCTFVKPFDRIPKAITTNESHGIEWTSIRMLPKAIYGDDSGVL